MGTFMNFNTLKETPPKPSRYIRKPIARPLYSKNPVLARAEVQAIRARGSINLEEARELVKYGLKKKLLKLP